MAVAINLDDCLLKIESLKEEERYKFFYLSSYFIKLYDTSNFAERDIIFL